jgi:hypothetical protein
VDAIFSHIQKEFQEALGEGSEMSAYVRPLGPVMSPESNHDEPLVIIHHFQAPILEHLAALLLSSLSREADSVEIGQLPPSQSRLPDILLVGSKLVRFDILPLNHSTQLLLALFLVALFRI